MRNVVIAGASNAGLSAARELRRGGFDGRIQLVDLEPQAPYRRPEVSKGILDGHLTRDTIAIAWPEDLDLERVSGVRLHGLDLQTRTVEAVEGRTTLTLPFDGLVIATGAVARPSPFDPHLPGVHTLRSVQDGEHMRADLVAAERVVIIGGGFIGLEVAAVARGLGKSVTVVEATDIPLGHVLGTAFGQHVAQTHRDRGVELITGVSVTSLDARSSGSVGGVSLSDGRELPADVVLVSIGAAPAVDWLVTSGLDVANGVVCDSTCAVEGVDGVVAAGDVASWVNPLYDRRMRVEHWTNAIEQGTFAARRLLGTHAPQGFVSAPYFWSDQYGMRLQSIGSTLGYDEVEVLERDGDRLLVAYGRRGRLVCITGVAAGAAVMGYRKLVLEGAAMEAVREGAAQSPAIR